MRGPQSIAARASLPMAAAFAIALLATGCGDEIKLERRTVTFPNGKSIREDWTFMRKPNGDSLEHGVHKKFFWSGSTSESVIWKMGKRDGSAQAWYENGSVKWQKNYDDGKKQGTWRLSYKDGHPWIVVNYDKDQINGTVQVWDKSGATEPKTAEYANGVCKSGDCALLDAPVAPPDMAVNDKVELTRDWDIVKEFLDL
ncbi:MAG: repeat variant [Fibrobacteres bacterium]|nr:repeat variant [Fibrobacterota bacterium]